MRVGVLLAAGASRRFGNDDKLLAPFEGKPLVTHAAQAMRAAGMDALVAVVRSREVAEHLPGFDWVVPPEANPLQADSLRAGVGRAEALGATRIVIALGDMPRITPDLLKAVLAACTDARAASASHDEKLIPPVCFPASYIPKLLALSGDRGAATLLKEPPTPALVPAPASCLRDIDVVSDLEELGRRTSR